MTILRDISILWSFIHVLVLFIFLYESRFSKKKTLIWTLAVMTPLIVLNMFLFFKLGPQLTGGALIMLTCTLPSLIFFWIMAKHRDGRFFFTFCMVDTLSYEIMCITNIIDFYLGETYIFLFVARLILFPLLEWFVYKQLRPTFLSVQQHTKKGWYTFAAVGAIFYVVLILSMTTPTLITERPEELLAFIMLLVLMPVLYLNIFFTLRNQQKIHEVNEQDSLLHIQVSNMTTRIEELNTAEERAKIERHDFRHKMQTIIKLIENEKYGELKELAKSYDKDASERSVKHYCSNAVIDAVLASYISIADARHIKVNTGLTFPDTLPIDDAELATVFANAIENAINACEKIDESKRHIEIQVIKSPRFMIQISNSFNGEVEFDKNGIPVSHTLGHGIGTRSIVAFCEKHNAFYEFKAEDKKFLLRIVFS